MDQIFLKEVVLGTLTTVLLALSAAELIVIHFARLWKSVRKTTDIIVETKTGPVRVSVNPESEESVRRLLDVVEKAESRNEPGSQGRQQ